MSGPVLVDNDVVLKLCRYGCHRSLGPALPGRRAAMLAVGRHALRDRVRRLALPADRDRVGAALDEALGDLDAVQPDEAEAALAAEMEEVAAKRALEFDTGESQLLAILLIREAPLLLTGDKRAIAAIAGMGVTAAEGRVACLEQLVATLLDVAGLARIRAGVCADPAADRAVAACFACSAAAVTAEDVRAGLRSYVSHLRAASRATLAAGDDLSATARTEPPPRPQR